jgi:hypothetical protein
MFDGRNDRSIGPQFDRESQNLITLHQQGFRIQERSHNLKWERPLI